jgi:hypothetical protein
MEMQVKKKTPLVNAWIANGTASRRRNRNRVKGVTTMTTNRARLLMTQIGIRHFLAVLCIVLAAEPAWAACSTGGQLARLGASPAHCTQGQLGTLDKALSDKLQFRAVLDLPLATQVLRERKCPSAEEFEAFFAAWKQLPGTGFRYTVKKYCLTQSTVYGIRFPFPDKPLDDVAAAELSADIDTLENAVIPALASKLAAVDQLVQ